MDKLGRRDRFMDEETANRPGVLLGCSQAAEARPLFRSLTFQCAPAGRYFLLSLPAALPAHGDERGVSSISVWIVRLTAEPESFFF